MILASTMKVEDDAFARFIALRSRDVEAILDITVSNGVGPILELAYRLCVLGGWPVNEIVLKIHDDGEAGSINNPKGYEDTADQFSKGPVRARFLCF